MNIIKNLSNDIQELIYNQYLEKQRDYYVYQYNNRIKLLYFDKLKQNIEHINSFIVDDYFDKLKNKRSSLQEKKDDTTGRGKKPIKVNLKNLVDKAKKNPLNKNLGVKITDTDNNTIKQSEISKQAKQFTKKIEKNQTVKAIQKDADRLVRKAEKGDKKARKKIFKVLDKKFKKLSPADQEAQAKKCMMSRKKWEEHLIPKLVILKVLILSFKKVLAR